MGSSSRKFRDANNNEHILTSRVLQNYYTSSFRLINHAHQTPPLLQASACLAGSNNTPTHGAFDDPLTGNHQESYNNGHLVGPTPKPTSPSPRPEEEGVRITIPPECEGLTTENLTHPASAQSAEKGRLKQLAVRKKDEWRKTRQAMANNIASLCKSVASAGYQIATQGISPEIRSCSFV